MKRIRLVLIALVCIALAGCGTVPSGTEDVNISGSNTPSVSGIKEPEEIELPAELVSGTVTGNYDCTIALQDDASTVSGTGASVQGNVVTITAGGKYLITGSLSNGQLIVDSADAEKVRITLNGVSINCQDSAAIYIKNAEKTILELAQGSVNIVQDGSTYNLAEGQDEPSACIFSKDDIKIKGLGALYVQGNYNKGIFSKDDLEIEEASLYVTAVDDGLRGKDSVQIASGHIVITAGGDGIRTSNETEEGRGYIDIQGGEIEITAELDALQAVTDLTITGGTFTLKSGGGSENASQDNDSWGEWGGGPGGGGPGGNAGGWKGGRSGLSSSTSSDATTETTSAKGIKAANSIFISGGEFSIDSSDDSIHCNGTISISGGEFSMASGDDGMHADDTLTITDGVINIAKSYEGLEAENLILYGGTVHITASDDGLNAAGGNDGSGMNRPGQGGFFGGGSAGSGSIEIGGGTYIINASGDGVDSNGTITMTAGSLVIFGPTNSGNGALDYENSFLISGGSLVAFGASGMAQSTSSGSAQACLYLNLSGSANKTFAVQDANGNTIAQETPPKTYACVVVSNPSVVKGQSYTIVVDGSKAGSATAK